jgi:hypothetical protein
MRGLALAAAALLGSTILLGAPGPAGADGDLREAHRAPKRHRSAQILLDMNDALGVDRAEGGSFRIRKRYGFEYAHRFEANGGGPPLVLSIQGPAMPRKRLGLCIELRF